MSPHFFSFLNWTDVVHGVSLPSLDFSFSSPNRSLALDQLTHSLKLKRENLFFPWIRQVHGNRIQRVTAENLSQQETEFPDTDGVITDQKRVFMSVLSADCVPVFFKDKTSHVLGLVHAGWRGAQKGIVENMIDVFRVHYSIPASQLQVGLGPSIRACCYEVKEDVAQFFQGSTENRQWKIYLNLPQFIQKTLEQNGVDGRQINDCGRCTACDQAHFFSYRRDAACGRQMAFLLKP
jgi:YfiH family protein